MTDDEKKAIITKIEELSHDGYMNLEEKSVVNIPILRERGDLYLQINQYNSALSDYDEAINNYDNCKPDRFKEFSYNGSSTSAYKEILKIYYNKGQVHHRLQQYDLAIASCSHAIEHVKSLESYLGQKSDPDPKLFKLRAKSYHMMALQDYQRMTPDLIEDLDDDIKRQISWANYFLHKIEIEI
jgi:tetratricopeptide (TPR) repeat protein